MTPQGIHEIDDTNAVVSNFWSAIFKADKKKGSTFERKNLLSIDSPVRKQ